MPPTVRPLAADEWRIWRDLRLRALGDAPDAFMGTLEDEAARPDSFWQEVVAATAAHPRGNLWVAEDETGAPAGMAFGRVDPDIEGLHIFAMWVDPTHRGSGHAGALLDAVLAWGREAGAERVDLWVTEGNQPAETLYARAGFRPTRDRGPLRAGSDRTVVRLERPL